MQPAICGVTRAPPATGVYNRCVSPDTPDTNATLPAGQCRTKRTKRTCAGRGRVIAHTDWATPHWHLCPHGRVCFHRNLLGQSDAPGDHPRKGYDPRYAACNICAKLRRSRVIQTNCHWNEPQERPCNPVGGAVQVRFATRYSYMLRPTTQRREPSKINDVGSGTGDGHKDRPRETNQSPRLRRRHISSTLDLPSLKRFTPMFSPRSSGAHAWA
jgi:hypothetical protein